MFRMLVRKYSAKNVCILALAASHIFWLAVVYRNCSEPATNVQCPKSNVISDVGSPDGNTVDKNKPQPSSSHRLQAPRSENECFLFVMIISSVDGRLRRDVARETWMKDHTLLMPKVIVKFIIGTLSLTQESMEFLVVENREHSDLILLPDLKESFTNLTRKVLSSFVHISGTYSLSYLFKGDDDTFIRLDLLLQELKARPTHNRYYWGFFDGRSKPKKAGKYVETEWFVCDLYVPYALGGGYVISSDLINRISVNSDGLKMFNAEDISVGLWLSGFDIERKHDVRFDTEYVSRGCRNVYLVTHKQSAGNMRKKYASLRETGQLCTVEEQTRLSYQYDWSVPPSQCCKREKGIP